MNYLVHFGEPLELMKNKSDILVENADSNIVDNVILTLLFLSYFLKYIVRKIIKIPK